jgi:transcriptional regulator with XRE-family HTH domain
VSATRHFHPSDGRAAVYRRRGAATPCSAREIIEAVNIHDAPDLTPWGAAHARELPHGSAEPAPPAHERRRELGVPDDAERARLASRFGSVLRTERGNLTQQQLADRAKLDRKTVVRLENGGQRPTAASIWKIARALRSDLRAGQSYTRSIATRWWWAARASAAWETLILAPPEPSATTPTPPSVTRTFASSWSPGSRS